LSFLEKSESASCESRTKADLEFAVHTDLEELRLAGDEDFVNGKGEAIAGDLEVGEISSLQHLHTLVDTD
jgi:hypothetical protein